MVADTSQSTIGARFNLNDPATNVFLISRDSRRTGAGSVVVRYSNSDTLVVQCPLVAVGSPYLASAGGLLHCIAFLISFVGFKKIKKRALWVRVGAGDLPHRRRPLLVSPTYENMLSWALTRHYSPPYSLRDNREPLFKFSKGATFCGTSQSEWCW